MKNLLKLKRLYILLLIPLSLILLFLAKRSPDFAEWYALNIYPVFALSINKISSVFPFSLMEFSLIILVPLAVFFLIFSLIKIIKKKKAFLFAKYFLNILCTASIIFGMFSFCCGTNYYRYTFSQISNLKIEKSTDKELAALCADLAAKLNKEREKLPEDENGIMKTSFENYNLMAKEGSSCVNSLSQKYPTLNKNYGNVKAIKHSRIMSYTNITGVFSSFTMECNVNVDQPDYNIASTMCHEISHIHGYMREDEANFIAYLICQESKNPEFLYSGLMLAFIYSNNALYSSNYELGRETFSLLSDEVKNDIYDNSAYWKQFEGPVAEISDAVNDTYLKANDQQDGTKSYGRVVDLLLAEYKAQKN